MPVSIFNNPADQKKKKISRQGGRMRSNTLREFGGGWNVIDAPTGLSTRFASVLKNFYRRKDGSQSIRYGTAFKNDISLDDDLRLLPIGTRGTITTGITTEQMGDTQANGKNFAMRFQATATGPLVNTFLEVTTVTAAGTFTAAIYTDGGTGPGSIIGAASAPVVIDTADTIYEFAPVPGTDLVQNTLYWVVFSETTTTGNILFKVVPNTGTGAANFRSGKHDTITSIADGQMTSGNDLYCLINISQPIAGDEIVNMVYFNNNIISVTNNGEIVATDASYNNAGIWSDGFANALIGAPDGWGNTHTLVTFTEIKGSLVVCNGVDKPLEIQNNLSVRYLQDLANETNINVPIAKFCTTVADYLILAGIDGEESTIYIGAKGTIGVFPGDPDPNDAVAVDLGAYAPEDSKEIRGVSNFRNVLYVHFLSATLSITLGEYDENDDHIPSVDDTLQKFGLIAHRASVPIVNDLLFGDATGVNTVKKNILSGITESDRLSELIAPEYQRQIASVDQDELQNAIFGCHDRLAGKYMIFVPTGVGNAVRAFVFTFNERMRIKAWSEFIGWEWKCATSSALGRLFFAKDTRHYQYGNEAYNEEYSADFIGEYDDTWANNIAYTTGDRLRDSSDESVWVVLVDHTSEASGTFEEAREANPTLYEEYVGEPIEFDWEFPWTDFGSRTRLKRLGFVRFDTEGTGQFTVSIFVDNIYLNESLEYDPALALTFVAGDSLGYGGGDQPYGGGRRTTDERLWSHPVKFMILKYRMHGSTTDPIRVISLSSLFAEGRYGR